MSSLRTTKEVRESLQNQYIRAKGKVFCPYCQRELRPFEKKDAAHIKAATNFGEAKHGNIVLAHSDCNFGTETLKLKKPLSRYVFY